jgi:hypothetical protein
MSPWIWVPVGIFGVAVVRAFGKVANQVDQNAADVGLTPEQWLDSAPTAALQNQVKAQLTGTPAPTVSGRRVGAPMHFHPHHRHF